MPEPLRSPARPRRRWLRRLLLTVLVAIAASAALLYWRLRAPLPDTRGTVKVDGVSAPVEIVRDIDDVAHIRADSQADALFGLGYVHAQERLWQMEFQRRVAQGRLAEIAGPEALPADRLLRTVGLARAARDTWPRLDGRVRALVEAYVAGVNAFLERHRGGGLPIEFAIFRVSPDPWTGEDVVAWQKTMGWLLSANWLEESFRAALATRVGDEGASVLMPAYTPGGPIILPPDAPLPSRPLPGAGASAPGPAGTLTTRAPGFASASARTVGAAAAADLAALAAIAGRVAAAPPIGGGSNNWVVSGSRSVTGKPLLANDPHLAGQAPAVWYLAHVTGGGYDAIGATMPGMPGIVLGHNGRIAWGVTALVGDVQDLYIERITARDQTEYQGALERIRVVREVIRVRGQADVPIRIRITRHGPVVSDALERPQSTIALRWTGLDAEDHTLESFIRLGSAGGWSEFRSALRGMHVPLLNFVYADVDGNIGYLGPGAIPVRTSGDGARPVAGWTGEAEWRGYLDESEWPVSYNPARGYLASANNKVAPDSFPFLLGTSWDAPYRAARIVELLEERPRLSAEDFARMQGDLRSAQVAAILPFLLTARPLGPPGRDAMALLREWNGTLDGASPEAALFEAWYDATVRALFADELGDDLAAEYVLRRSSAAKAIDSLVQSGDSAWCDDVRTPEPETCGTLLGRTLQRALAEMGARQGTSNVTKWRWDRVNAARFPHAPLDAVPVLRRYFSRTVPHGGDAFTLTPVSPIGGDIFVSSYRQIIDLAGPDASRFMIPMGQSGHVWSDRYANLLDPWRRVEYIPMRFTRAAVDDAARATLVLEQR
ncbi:MAG TPA: penicillin acylase family protein [Vicinamibacterales bacterium]|nr:penicillin acylase family protein [Vicinamibacterales bacterium]HPW21280.1 penicillin acylase family protein [Vicinamibacterales bacterium]